MLIRKLSDYRIILASQSPRRSFLLKEAGIHFQQADAVSVEEVYPKGLSPDEITSYLSKLKSAAYSSYLKEDKDILITADTIVWQNEKVIGKPVDYEDAYQKLKGLSNSGHEVYTGVCIKSLKKETIFSTRSKVVFDSLDEDEISFYLDTYKPFDKAGAYGIQEWIGYVGIKSIEGSFYNVMGLPIHQLYVELKQFISD